MLVLRSDLPFWWCQKGGELFGESYLERDILWCSILFVFGHVVFTFILLWTCIFSMCCGHGHGYLLYAYLLFLCISYLCHVWTHFLHLFYDMSIWYHLLAWKYGVYHLHMFSYICMCWGGASFEVSTQNILW